MKKVFAISILLAGFFALLSFTNHTTPEEIEKKVTWYTWEEAVKANETTPKKFFVDVYTDWCGWCKVMDKKTFTDPKVAAYLNKYFYAIKLDAEQKEDILFQGNTFSWVKSGRKGVHSLAYSLLEGKMSYPSFVFLNEKYERIMISPGYKKPEDILPELEFAVKERYKTLSWEEFQQQKAKEQE